MAIFSFDYVGAVTRFTSKITLLIWKSTDHWTWFD